MTEAPLNPKACREKMAQLVLESFQIPKFFLSVQALNALYCEGLQSGIVLEAGEGISTCVPVIEGFAIAHAI